MSIIFLRIIAAQKLIILYSLNTLKFFYFFLLNQFLVINSQRSYYGSLRITAVGGGGYNTDLFITISISMSVIRKEELD